MTLFRYGTLTRPLLFGTLALSLLVASCGSGAVPPTATPRPTATATIMSTPLPPVARSESRPDDQYQFAIASGINAGSEGEIASLGSFINAKTILTASETQITFTMASLSGSEAIDALCGTTPTFAFVDGWTMLAAQARGCAKPVLQVQRGGANGYRVELLYSRQLTDITSAADLKGRIYCRIEGEDVSTWFLPSILVRTVGKFDPVSGFQSVRIVPDLKTLLSEVGYARCVGAVEVGSWQSVRVPGFAGIARSVGVVPGVTMPSFPFGGLVASNNVPDRVIKQFKTVILDNLDEIKPVIKFDTLEDATETTFASAADFLRRAGIDLGRE